ncbi:MAG: beta-N-acetylhexosaminidase [Candidatus Pelagibacterales bacterium]|jgi:beta-N-acetylhexosaminidase|nr:beta-N-acetylhexosaminidase [Pelagibacterales bacterium]MBL6861851.1 beta-N-acetylhexosaminidase [Pelagibacterales bacterium]|tara:strand:+ start:7825 stop:8835 length:1011 start_codon:yes stop_codon:yes gene_type:complete
MSKYLPLIIGLEGTILNDNETKFLSDYKPWGVILFQRNCINHKDTLTLIDKIKSKTHKDMPILIDQEGGRVSRLNYPEFPRTLSAKLFGDIFIKDKELALRALTLNINLIAGSLKDMGININTVPVLDIPSQKESGVIGDRAYSSDKDIVSQMGKIVLNENNSNGIGSVIKHIPGHGRATVDSHLDLPIIIDEKSLLENDDFVPFKALNNAPLAMTAHAIYEKFDKNNVATLSKTMITEIIRSKIGFKGTLMTDDVSMKALSGDVGTNSLLALQAGCDLVLHCNGNFDEICQIADKISMLNLISIDPTLLDVLRTKKSLNLGEITSELTHILSKLS